MHTAHKRWPAEAPVCCAGYGRGREVDILFKKLRFFFSFICRRYFAYLHIFGASNEKTFFPFTYLSELLFFFGVLLMICVLGN